VEIRATTIAGDGNLIEVQPGSRLTLRDVTAQGGTGRFVAASMVATLAVYNSTVIRTSGIYVHGTTPGASITVARNRARSLQSPGFKSSFLQLDKVSTARIDVAWNEVINVFGKSSTEDIISLHRTSFARVHDNYIQGAYPTRADAPFSGSGIMIEGSESQHNAVYENHVVETTNAGIGIAGGRDNEVYENRIVFDGRLWDGTRLVGANVGLYVWNSVSDAAWANNDAWGNQVGWRNSAGSRNDWWLPDCSGTCSNQRLRGKLTRERELAEYRLWRTKASTRGIRIGRLTVRP
jgi:hypothetical protein